MRTRDAVRDEQMALEIALSSGNGTCPLAPGAYERDGWKGQLLLNLHLAAMGHATEVRALSPRAYRRMIERFQRGVLAREIWEGLPRKQKWWLR